MSELNTILPLNSLNYELSGDEDRIKFTREHSVALRAPDTARLPGRVIRINKHQSGFIRKLEGMGWQRVIGDAS